jgi:hypothetical protein
MKFRKRQGRCYELAWKMVAYDVRFSEWSLVHGEIVSPIGNGQLMGHAWLVLNERIYDPGHWRGVPAADHASGRRACTVRTSNLRAIYRPIF